MQKPEDNNLLTAKVNVIFGVWEVIATIFDIIVAPVRMWRMLRKHKEKNLRSWIIITFSAPGVAFGVLVRELDDLSVLIFSILYWMIFLFLLSKIWSILQ